MLLNDRQIKGREIVEIGGTVFSILHQKFGDQQNLSKTVQGS